MMSVQEIIFSIVWIVLSFAGAFYLQKKFSLFRRFLGVLVLFGCFILSVFLHNVIYGLFQSYFDSKNGDEAIFFILALFSFGASIALLVIQAIRKLIKIFQGN